MSVQATLRKEIITQRKALSAFTQRTAAKHISQHLLNSALFQQSDRIAFYQATNGEINPHLILQEALSLGKECFLPVLHPIKHNLLWFMPYRQNTKLVPNQYGILEPEVNYPQLVSPWSLQLVLTPLVAFDLVGNRLGMGGGYYDRTFAFVSSENFKPKPYLIGLGYDFQKVEKLPTNPWDVALNSAITESFFYHFPR